MFVWSTLSSRILRRLKPPVSIDEPFSFPLSCAFAKPCRMINGRSKQESPWKSSILSISRSSQVLVIFERLDVQQLTFRSWARVRNSIWGEELCSCCTIRRRETSMVVPFDLHSQQKVISLVYSSVWIHLPLPLYSILQRDLYNLLVHEDAQQVLLTPDPSLYKYIVDLSLSLSLLIILFSSHWQNRFSVENSGSNILIDYPSNDTSSSSFTIRGATIEKLIEYLTHHQFLHPRFVKSFLMTYKSYCSPVQLLNLLIERFHIPEPASSYLYTEQQLKKFRKEYVQPVQLRYACESEQPIDWSSSEVLSL